MRITINIITMLAILVIILPLATAGSITCDKCEINNCNCTISACKGIMRIWKFSKVCLGIWDFEREVSDSRVIWYPPSPGEYYARVFNGSHYCTECTVIKVSGITSTSTSSSTTSVSTQKTTTTSKTTTTITKKECPYECCIDDPKYEDKPCEDPNKVCCPLDIGYECRESCEVPTTKKTNLVWIMAIAIIALIPIMIFLLLLRRKPETKVSKRREETF